MGLNQRGRQSCHRMKKYFLVFLVMFLTLSAHAVPAVVDYVVDGDTFAARVSVADDVQITVRVRLINVDTPELNGKCQDEVNMARRARGRMEKLLPRGTRIELENIKDDKYLGRIDANVFTPDGRDVGEVLVREKLARRYRGGRRQGWCGK